MNRTLLKCQTFKIFKLLVFQVCFCVVYEYVLWLHFKFKQNLTKILFRKRFSVVLSKKKLDFVLSILFTIDFPFPEIRHSNAIYLHRWIWLVNVLRKIRILHAVTKKETPYWKRKILYVIITTIWYDLIWFDLFLLNATFSNISAISWQPVLMVRGFKGFYNRRYFLNFRRYLKN